MTISPFSGLREALSWQYRDRGGNAWEDQDFLKPFDDQGTKIELRDEDAVTTKLTVISIKREGNDQTSTNGRGWAVAGTACQVASRTRTAAAYRRLSSAEVKRREGKKL
jgi:hypothetical protein